MPVALSKAEFVAFRSEYTQQIEAMSKQLSIVINKLNTLTGESTSSAALKKVEFIVFKQEYDAQIESITKQLEIIQNRIEEISQTLPRQYEIATVESNLTTQMTQLVQEMNTIKNYINSKLGDVL